MAMTTIMAGIEAGEEVKCFAGEADYAGDARGLKRGFANFLVVANDDAEAGFGAGIHALDVRAAAECGDPVRDFLRRFGVAQL